MRPLPKRLLAALAGALLAGGCGKAVAPKGPFERGSATSAPGALALATKNTTRLGGADAASNAAAVARAVYPGLTAATRPQAVAIVDERDWSAALAASVLASAPLGAPLLYAQGASLPEASARALEAMRPMGSRALHGAQAIRVGSAAPVPGGGLRTATLAGGDPARVAAEVASVAARAAGHAPRQVIVLAEEEPRALQMPAAALAAVSGAPILFTASSSVPAATARELRRLRHPSIYLPGGSPVTAAVRASLSRLGRVVRIAGAEAGEAGGHPPSVAESRDPIANAISVARFSDGSFGWGIHEAGHGLVFASAARPLDAPAAAALASHGDYGPLLLLNARGSVPAALARYLSNIEPGYTASVSPVREVYNHGWLIGDQSAIPSLAQAELDAILEVAPRTPGSGETPVAPAE